MLKITTSTPIKRHKWALRFLGAMRSIGATLRSPQDVVYRSLAVTFL